METKKLCQLLPKLSAIQLAVEHKLRCTDQLKIKNTTNHIVQTVSVGHTASYSTGIWGLSWE